MPWSLADTLQLVCKITRIIGPCSLLLSYELLTRSNDGVKPLKGDVYLQCCLLCLRIRETNVSPPELQSIAHSDHESRPACLRGELESII
jgi:hypothetical protein